LSTVPIEVRLKDGRLMTGHVGGVSETTLTLLVGGQATSIDEGQVLQVDQLVRKSPAVPILAGVGTGLATAGLISLVLDEIFVNAPEASMFAIAPAAGATIGYVFGRGTRRVLIYDAGAAGALTTPRTAGGSRSPGVSVSLAWVGIRRGVSVNVRF
jgi:hypothetical protein